MGVRSALLKPQHLLDPTLEHTLIVVKPDGYARGLADGVLRRTEAKDYTIKGLRLMIASRELLAEHYVGHEGKPFFEGLLEFMNSDPVVAIVVEGQRVVEGMRVLMGSIDPAAAPAGTTRGDLDRTWDSLHMENLIHGSDSVDNATREISLWLPEIY